jgi:DNA excision repair protein ERCC-2
VEFPYEPRKGQSEFMEAMARAISEERHLIAEAGTGTGKTISALFPALDYALNHGKKILYLTRTNSQQDQVMSEFRAIKKRNRSAIYAIALQGRANMCPLAMRDEELKKGTAEELAKLCSEKKRKVMNGDDEACPYYAETITYDIEKLRKWVAEHVPTSADFTRYCLEERICPYEANKELMSGAILVSAPYIYFFNPGIRRALLSWMGISISDLIVIVDEAHNLPEFARELISADLSIRSLANANGEVERFGDPEVLDGVSVGDVIDVVKETIIRMAEEFIPEDAEDSFIPEKEFESALMSEFHINSRKIDLMAKNLMEFGDIIREKRKEMGKLPRSYIYKLGDFISFWTHLEANEYIKLIKGGENPRLEAYCMDASLATDVLNLTHASIHMSGTLEPMEEYRDTIGLSYDTEILRVESPFPPENRLILYSPAATTRYEEMKRNSANISVLEEQAFEIATIEGKNVAVFFPSFSMLERFLEDSWHTRLQSMGKTVFMERKGMSTHELMDMVSAFKRRKNSVMMAVMGGRISEGIDFPEESLEIEVIIGLPYPKPTAKQRAMERYYDMKFGKGWEYVVRAPTIRKLLQTIGRLIRTEKDRGVAVILDRRAVQLMDRIPMKKTENPKKDVKGFFES